jgi:hypothetical protein
VSGVDVSAIAAKVPFTGGTYDGTALDSFEQG